MKISIDFHGVIEADPKRFEAYARELIEDGHEVYILTGSTYDDSVDELTESGFSFQYISDIISVTDTLLEWGMPWEYDKWHRPSFSTGVWWEAKGLIAKQYSIDLHIDDREEYLRTFTTPFALYRDGSFTITKV